MTVPYVVSADISLLLHSWGAMKGYRIPDGRIDEIRETFSVLMRRIFPSFEFVPEKELVDGIGELVSQSTVPAVSLDRVYYPSAVSIETCRCVGEDGRDLGVRHRAGTPLLIRQVKALREFGYEEIALVDDVVFTGQLLERVMRVLARAGIRVSRVYAGIGVAEGIKRICRFPVQVRCVRYYEEVVDEVCERDFFPGVPYSGRLLAGSPNTGVPYLFPFGDPHAWASVPRELERQFSEFCIRQTITLFEGIEQYSGRTVRCCDLDRKVASLPHDGTRFVDALQKLLDRRERKEAFGYEPVLR